MSDDFFTQDVDECNVEEQEEDPFADPAEDQEVEADEDPFGEATASTHSLSNESVVDEFKFTREWNMQFRERCDTKDKDAMEKKQVVLKKAREDLVAWNQERAKKLNTKAEVNRQEEEKLVEGNVKDLASENPWERVARLVEMSGDRDHDMSRMKQVMIRMKGDSK